ncbi:MAG TPA: hypothetical protein PKA58_22475 [Polyangium sp.]|nr:hypothetical protein [Polyangium sp.]
MRGGAVMKWLQSSTGRSAAVSLGFMALMIVGIGATSCIGEGENEAFGCPNKDVFVQNVSPFLERRCGTLDCHGQPTRPMRIYGQLGLRHPAETNVSGGAPTTQAELDANYAAVCYLDPEAMKDSADKIGASADKLLLVTKMRGLERHKGGQAVKEQSPGDRCVLNWLKFKSDTDVQPACTEAVNQLK